MYILPGYTTAEQLKAHHADLVWARVAKGEYLRSDGAMIRKTSHACFAWVAFHPDGSPMMHRTYQVGGCSLTAAKLDVTQYEESL